ncbi:MAG: thymidylate kinase [Candidatus Yanofskybacteria bacterium]|nr:thymidylate kinase [Candidatus Yanofskybacteria bacterium]
MSAKYPGKLIVCEGIDGSGKTEQFGLLQKRLRADGVTKVFTTDFPRYGHPAAWFVEKYLGKKDGGFERPGYGPADKVNKFFASLAYALDRFDAAFSQDNIFSLSNLLKDGFVVVSNRYMESNIGHQGAKAKDTVKQEKFIKWLLETEYELLEIPKPDLVLLFNVPPKIAWELKEEQLKKEEKEKDAHESNKEMLEKSWWAYMYAAKLFPDYWKIINVFSKEEQRLLTIPEVHELAWQEVKKLFAK